MAQTIAESLIEEGMAKGQLLAARTIVRALLEDRFGPAPETLVQQINACNDLERLQSAARQVSRILSADELKL